MAFAGYLRIVRGDAQFDVKSLGPFQVGQIAGKIKNVLPRFGHGRGQTVIAAMKLRAFKNNIHLGRAVADTNFQIGVFREIHGYIFMHAAVTLVRGSPHQLECLIRALEQGRARAAAVFPTAVPAEGSRFPDFGLAPRKHCRRGNNFGLGVGNQADAVELRREPQIGRAFVGAYADVQTDMAQAVKPAGFADIVGPLPYLARAFLDFNKAGFQIFIFYDQVPLGIAGKHFHF